jgi:hypothetical protein
METGNSTSGHVACSRSSGMRETGGTHNPDDADGTNDPDDPDDPNGTHNPDNPNGTHNPDNIYPGTTSGSVVRSQDSY